jgi:glycopeptide antibiotics resistance protein
MKKRILLIVILITYCAILIKVMVFKDLPVIRIGHLMLNFGGTQEGPANLIPFKTILPYLLGEKGFIIAFLNLAGNIVLLVPVGFLVPFAFRSITWKKSFVIAIACGFVIEGMQVLLHVGIFDIDDVILNGLGVMVGYWSFLFFQKMMGSKQSKKIFIVTSIVIALVVTVFAVYIFRRREERVRFEPATENVQLPDISGPGDVNTKPDSTKTGKLELHKGPDPCNGTGGTGQIVAVGVHQITIKGKDGIPQIIQLTNQTRIRYSAGPAAESDLKIGYGVTIVTGSERNDKLTAVLVLICNAISPEPVK